MHNTLTQADIVDDLAEEFIARYRNGERPALSEFAARCPERADEIRELFPALVALEQAAQPGSSDDSSTAAPGPEPLAIHQLGDFRIIREVGRGGMGVVYEAEQVSLGRRVALKVLPRQALLDSRHKQRFEREARAAARLHHTNIVPVFGVGQQDGLHYYVMQFIHGLGLDEVLLELKRLRVEGPESRVKGQAAAVGVQALACAGQPEGWTPTRNDPSAVGVAQSLLSGRFDRTLLVESDSRGSDQPSALSNQAHERKRPSLDPQPLTLDQTTAIGRLSDTFALPGHSEQTSKSHSRAVYWQSVARIGVQAAEALHYAHDQGIIHRDVKPGNLLLDTRGCVWVTDFGLAKAADQQDLTHTGDVLGTLRYMAPEQFDGKADARSDVHSLGLTLYELLSLQPAFDETERHKLVKQVTTGTPNRLRTLDRQIPRDLETIVHKAIEREPAQRYATAGELAADLRRYLGDEPIHARRPPVLQRLAKWGRRHRAVIATASLCLLVGTALLAGTIGWAVRDREARHAAVEEETKLALGEAERWADQEKWPEALDAVKRGEGLLAGGGGELRDSLREIRKDLEMQIRLEDVRLLATQLQNNWHEWDALHDGYVNAFADYGIDVVNLPVEEAAARIRARDRLAIPLAVTLDVWSCTGSPKTDKTRTHLRAVAGAVDPDPWRRRVREALGRRDGAALTELAAEADLARQSWNSLIVLEHGLRRCGHPDQALDVRRLMQQHHPADFWANYWLAHELYWLAETDFNEIVAFARAAVAARPNIAAAHLLLALALQRSGKLDEAVVYHLKSIALAPNNPFAHHDYGWTLRLQGKYDEAVVSLQKAIDLWPENDFAYRFLGHTLHAQKKPDEAAAAFRQAIAIKPGPNEYFALGLSLREANKTDEAVAAYRMAIEHNPNHARAYNNLGSALTDQKKYDEAVAAYRMAIEIDPKFAVAYSNLGNTLGRQGKLDEAIAAFREAIRYKPDYALAHHDLGVTLSKKGLTDEAIAQYREAIELNPNHAGAHMNLGIALGAQGKLDDAIASFDRAIELEPDYPRTWNARGHIHQGLKQYEKAIADHSKAIDLDPKYTSAHIRLGEVLCDVLREYDKAVACFTRAIELDPDEPIAWHNRAVAHRGLKQYDEAIADCSKAIELDPDDASAWRIRHELYEILEQYDRAVAVYSKAIDGKPDNFMTWYYRGQAYGHLKQYDRAVADYSKVIQLKSDSISAFGARSQAYVLLQQWDKAIADRTKVMELAPKSPVAINQLGWLLATCPDLKFRNPTRAVEFGKRAVELSPHEGAIWNTLGVAHYRAGEWLAAIEALQQSMELRAGGDGFDWFFLSMAHWQLGNKDEARPWYDRAVTWTDENRPEDEELRRFRAEAEELLGLKSEGLSKESAASTQEAVLPP